MLNSLAHTVLDDFEAASNSSSTGSLFDGPVSLSPPEAVCPKSRLLGGCTSQRTTSRTCLQSKPRFRKYSAKAGGKLIIGHEFHDVRSTT
jgi:hypothetical protein